MHVQANIAVKPSLNALTTDIIPWFTNFTLLFMIISAFSMCCGYYERVKNGAITPAKFYAKRYHRIWPFFALMVFISFAMDPSWSAFCDSFADLTMCFNLLPNPDIKVIGVGWFLGTIFTFYMLFPFFTFLLNSKKRGWVVMLLSLIFCFIAITYFGTSEFVVKPIGKENIIYSAPFFIAGGIVYLYRHAVKSFVGCHRYVALLTCLVLTTLRFTVDVRGAYIFPDLLIFTAWLMYSIGSHDFVLNNRIVKYLSGISMEIYLCHMMFYRVVSMAHFDRFVHDNDLLYIVTCLGTLAGAICFSHVIKYFMFPALQKYRLLKTL